MKKLWVLSVIVALLGLTSAADNLSEDLDSLTCSRSVEYSDGKILDIKKSVEMGAELLAGTWSENKESCLSKCCGRQDCDLALFKTDGVTKKGNNCYLVHCGDPKNCLMVDLSTFDSMYLRTSSSSKDAGTPGNTNTGQEPSRDKSAARERSPTNQTVAPPSSTPPRTKSSAKDTSTTAPVQQTKTSSKPSPEASTVKKSSSTHPPPSTSPNKVEVKEQNINEKKPGSEVHRNKACGAYGCDGSGVVAVVVVAAICTAIIIVVGAILLKKVVDERRRKKFRNVDYLINGMYT